MELRPFAQAATYIAEEARRSVQERGFFNLVLAGGATPRGVYERLASHELRAQVPWERVRVFWGDERRVPRDHPASNYRMAREALLRRVPLSEQNVFPVPADAPTADEAARKYEGTLRELFPGAVLPAFDLVLLGIGADGHTASLFPGGPECEEPTRWCVASLAPPESPPRERVTLTLPALNAARTAAFLVAGEEKRSVLTAVLHPGPEAELPAQRIRAAEGGLRAAGAVLLFTDLLP